VNLQKTLSILTILISFLVVRGASADSEIRGNGGADRIAPVVGGKPDACTNPNLKCENSSFRSDDSASEDVQDHEANAFMELLAKKTVFYGETPQQHAGVTTGNHVGNCMAGVAFAVTEACNGKERAQGICGNASGSGKCFAALGFRSCTFTQANRAEMQALGIKGLIFVFSGGPNGDGHTEIYSGYKDTGFCSDHCDPKPMTSLERVPEAIFVPPGFKIPPDSPLKCDPKKG
jgi:hypothetical protein